MSHSTNITKAAKTFHEALVEMRQYLPGVPDDSLITIATALAESDQKSKVTVSVDKVQTLSAALAEILNEGQASRGELCRAIKRQGYGYLSNGRDLYGAIGRTLSSDPQFEQVHRGLWRMKTPEAPKPEAKLIIEDKAESTLREAAKLSQPFLARDIVDHSDLTMPWVIVGLKELHKAGKVRIVEKLTNGMARWEIVRD